MFSGLPYPEKKDFGEGEQEDFPKKLIQEALYWAFALKHEEAQTYLWDIVT